MKKTLLFNLMLYLGCIHYSLDAQQIWTIIDNTTPFDVTCTLRTTILKNKKVTMQEYLIPDNALVHIYQDEEYNTYLISYLCKPKEHQVIYSFFSYENKPYFPKIIEVAFHQNILQIASLHLQKNMLDRYFQLHYDILSGMSIKSYSINWYIKYAHTCKTTLQYILTAILQATDYLPY